MVKQTTKKTVKKTASKTASKTTVKAKKPMIDSDFQPNKMGFAVASLAAVSLVLLGMIAMYG